MGSDHLRAQSVLTEEERGRRGAAASSDMDGGAGLSVGWKDGGAPPEEASVSLCGVYFKRIDAKAVTDGVKHRADKQVSVKADELVPSFNHNEVFLTMRARCVAKLFVALSKAS